MKKGFVFIVLSAVLFSTMEIVLKLVAGKFNPIELTFLRFIIGGLILLPFALSSLKKRGIRLERRDFAQFALTGFICVVVSMVLYQLAVLYAAASVVAVLFSCNPVFVAIFAFLLLHEKINRRTLISIAVSIIGILVIANPLHIKGNAAGIILTLLAAVTFALYGVTGKKESLRAGGTALTCFSFLLGGAELGALMALTHIGGIASALKAAGMASFASVPFFAGINVHTILSLAYIGVGVTGLGYCFYFLAMEYTSAVTASLVFFIKPVLAPVLALLILREPITVFMLIGILLILAGSLISFIPSVIRIRSAALQSTRLNDADKETEKELSEP